jgi:Ankyrin repeat
MTSREPDPVDVQLLERYRRASGSNPVAPSGDVRNAILAEGRRVAEQYAAPKPTKSLDTSQPAANQPRWKWGAYGTLGAAMLAALLIAPRFWERQHSQAPALVAVNAPRASSPAPPVAPAAAPAAASAAETSRAVDSLVADGAAKMPPAPTQNAAAAPAARSGGDDALAQADALAMPSRAMSPRALAISPRVSPLLQSVASGDLTRAASLLDQGAAVDEPDELGRTPLMLATVRGQVQAVRLLLDRGADPNAADNAGRLPLQQARLAHFSEIEKMLELAGAR